MEEQRNMNTLVSWGGLIVGVVALVIAVNAHNRTGQDVLGAARESLNQAGQSVQRQTALTQAQTRLDTIREDIREGRVDDETMNTLQEVRRDLEGVELGTNFNVQTQLNTLEAQIRQGTGNALGTVESIIAALRAEVENDD
jgi:hypothetical protein